MAGRSGEPERMTDQPLSLSQLAARKEKRRNPVKGRPITNKTLNDERAEAEADIDSYVQIIDKLVTAGEAMVREGTTPQEDNLGDNNWNRSLDGWRTLLKDLGEK